MKGIIYKYTFPDGKVYIGQTRRHPEKRKREHLAKDVGPTNKGFWEIDNLAIFNLYFAENSCCEFHVVTSIVFSDFATHYLYTQFRTIAILIQTI